MRGLWIFARLHGLFICSVAIAANAAANLLLAATTLEVGWLTTRTGLLVPSAPLVAAIAVLGFHPVLGPPCLGETTATRPVRAMRWLLFISLLGIAVVTLVGSGAAYGQVSQGVVAARNLIGSLGLVLMLRPALGEAAWLIPTCFVLTAILFGGTPDGRPEQWAWTLHPATSIPAAATVVVLASLGTLTLLGALGRHHQAHPVAP